MPTQLLDDPLKPKKPQQGPGLTADGAGPQIDTGGTGLGPQVYDPVTGMAGHNPSVSPQIPLGNPNAPPPTVFDPSSPRKAEEIPGYQDAGAKPPAAGGNDFPSLPPGATPPPGYYDPISGKTAGAAPGAPAQGPAPTAAPTAAPGTPAAPGAPAAPRAPGAPGAPANPAAPPTTVNDAYKKALIDGLTRGKPTLDDPELKAQTDAYALQQERAYGRARSDAAVTVAPWRAHGFYFPSRSAPTCRC